MMRTISQSGSSLLLTECVNPEAMQQCLENALALNFCTVEKIGFDNMSSVILCYDLTLI